MNPQTVESPVGAAGLIQLDFFPPNSGGCPAHRRTIDFRCRTAGDPPVRPAVELHSTHGRVSGRSQPATRAVVDLDAASARCFGVLAGYVEDCNDPDTLRTNDPVFKLIAERLPGDDALASQPTLSRFENPRPLRGFSRELIDFNIATGIERLRQHHGGQLPAAITAGPRRHRRSHPRPSATDVLPRLLRPVPILPP